MIIIIAVVIIEHGIRIDSVSNRTRNTRSVLMFVIGPGLVKLPSAFGHIAPSMPGSVYLLRPRIGGYHHRLAQTFASDTLQRHWRITWAFFHRADVKASPLPPADRAPHVRAHVCIRRHRRQARCAVAALTLALRGLDYFRMRPDQGPRACATQSKNMPDWFFSAKTRPASPSFR